MISVNAAVRDRGKPMYCVVYDLHLSGTAAHTRDETEKILKTVLPRIVQDYSKHSQVYFTRDGNLKNILNGSFTKHEGLTNMYCLPYMIIRQVASLHELNNQSVYHFTDADGTNINFASVFRPTARPTLMTKDSDHKSPSRNGRSRRK